MGWFFQQRRGPLGVRATSPSAKLQRMKLLRLIPLAVAPLVLAAFVQAPKVEAGFTSLFNGKDFTGWKLQNPGSFAIQDGAIVANGLAGYGHAFYDGPFRN